MSLFPSLSFLYCFNRSNVVTHCTWVLIALNESIWLNGIRWIDAKHLMAMRRMTVSGKRNLFFRSTNVRLSWKKKKTNKLKSVTLECLTGDLICSSLCTHVLIYVFRNRMNYLYLYVSQSTRPHTIGNIRRAKICYWWTTEMTCWVQMILECDWYCLIVMIVIVIEDKQINF
jgi:hypothetical protein